MFSFSIDPNKDSKTGTHYRQHLYRIKQNKTKNRPMDASSKPGPYRIFKPGQFELQKVKLSVQWSVQSKQNHRKNGQPIYYYSKYPVDCSKTISK